MRWLLVAGALSFAACSTKRAPVAELVKMDGPVEKLNDGDAAWSAVEIGGEFSLGDTAKTFDGGAGFTLLIAGGLQVTMEKYSEMVFGDRTQNTMEVGKSSLDLDDLSLTITAAKGVVYVARPGGPRTALPVGVATQIGASGLRDVGKRPEPADAGAIDAGPIDAGPVVIEPPASPLSIDVTGNTAQIQRAGDTKWSPLPSGLTPLPSGARVKTGSQSTAKLELPGTFLRLDRNSRVATSDGAVAMEDGNASVVVTDSGSVNLPGGSVSMKGTAAEPSAIKLNVVGKGTNVTAQRVGAKLTGSGGASLVMNRGETAMLLRSGTINPLEVIPTQFDFSVVVGERFTIHDPRPPTALRFQFGGQCPAGGIIELDRDARFLTPKVSAGKEAASHWITRGTWYYRLRCTTGANEGPPVASGIVGVRRDDGTRPLPPLAPVNPFSPNGWSFRVTYPTAIPDFAVTFPGASASYKLILRSRNGKELVFVSQRASLLVPGSKLREGEYTYSFERDNVKQDVRCYNGCTLTLQFEQTAAQVYVELPVNGKPWDEAIEVKGAVLPGWTAAVNGGTLPVEPATRRFNAQVDRPPGNALAIRLSHPQLGVHYYLRRQK